MADCAHPISSADIVDYWAGDLEALDETRIEDHIFSCAACASALAQGEALATAVKSVVRSDTFHSLISESVLNRLAREGARVRTYTVSPGDVVACAVWDGDDMVVTRLLGDFSEVDSVSVVATLASGQELSRSDDVTVHPGQSDLISATAAELLRHVPKTRVTFRITGSREGKDRLIGEYTLEHEGSLRHG